jgi:LuxR family transcriptional regulator, maltose regulon positive regulatory protein
LFAQLLSLELTEREPELAPVLHRRAAAWYRDAGDVEAAIDHAATAGEFARAGDLIARHWVTYVRRGRIATVRRWLDKLPDDVITANPPIALLAAWVGGLGNASRQEIEHGLAAAEATDYPAPLPSELRSVPFMAAMVRAVNVFDDVARSLRAARRAMEAAGPRASESYWMGATALGRSLYLSGQAAEARTVLEDVTGHAPAPNRQPFVVVNAFALLSLLTGVDGDDERALALARRAMDVAEAQGVRYDPLTGSPTSPLPGPRRAVAGWPRPSSCSTRPSRCCRATATRSSTRGRWSNWPTSAMLVATPTAPTPRSRRRGS